MYILQMLDIQETPGPAPNGNTTITTTASAAAGRRLRPRRCCASLFAGQNGIHHVSYLRPSLFSTIFFRTGADRWPGPFPKSFGGSRQSCPPRYVFGTPAKVLSPSFPLSTIHGIPFFWINCRGTLPAVCPESGNHKSAFLTSTLNIELPHLRFLVRNALFRYVPVCPPEEMASVSRPAMGPAVRLLLPRMDLSPAMGLS